MANKEVKIILITGYLGAGKTTLLNHILANDEGIRAAVIVNDIGEVNVDAALIQQGGLSQTTGDLVPLTNGCICCSLSEDFSKQLFSLATSGKFDYIVIEASGICEPIPIAYNIAAVCEQSQQFAASAAGLGDARTTVSLDLDNLVAVVDAARMVDEFAGGEALLSENIDDEDIEALLIQQIEFCTTVVLNKADLVSPEQLEEVKAIVRALQKDAVIVEAVNAEVPMAELLNTGRFDFNEAYNSAVWIDAMEHPEEHEEEEVLEYDISTFVYQRRKPFDYGAFCDQMATWPLNVIRVKGTFWSTDDLDMCCIFEAVGKQQPTLMENGLFVDSAPEGEKEKLLAENPWLLEDWDPVVGDRETKLVFIGRHMDSEAIIAGLDSALTEYVPE